jgi:hypothetical protein
VEKVVSTDGSHCNSELLEALILGIIDKVAENIVELENKVGDLAEPLIKTALLDGCFMIKEEFLKK